MIGSALARILIALLIIAVVGWLLATYVSGALAALVVLIGCVVVLVSLLERV